VIPEAAVEAAGRLIHSQHETSPLDEWSDIFQRQAKANARLVLEAAAPHIRAQALEDAADDYRHYATPNARLYLRERAADILE
jgi:hypothetical protein